MLRELPIYKELILAKTSKAFRGMQVVISMK